MTQNTDAEDAVGPPVQGPAGHALDVMLMHMLKIDASDLYLTADSPPVFRINGSGHPGRSTLDSAQVERMVAAVLTPAQRDEFSLKLELNFALARGDGRFRVNVFRQRGHAGMVVRLVRTKIKTLQELGYPPVMQDIALSRRGLVLVVGATGSGKSTALAAMIDYRNESEAGHIVTVEDPLEFIHPHKKSIVTQREVGADTLSYKSALENALRQAPDVILIGEIRNAETMEAAIRFADTGHLCISTLHANDATQTVERVLGFFASERHAEIRGQLSLNLRAVVSQRLVPALGGGRAAALDVLLDTPRVKALIRQGETESLKDAIEQSAPDGCLTFDASLLALVVARRISEDEALKAADSANNLRLRLERLRASAKASPRVGLEDELKLLVEPPRR